MNCHCNKPVINRIAQSGDHPGRSYFSCSSSSCRFFQWVDGHFPPKIKPSSVSTTTLIPTSSSSNKSTFSRQGQAHSLSSSSKVIDTVRSSDLPRLKLLLSSFEEKEDGSVTVWFVVLSSISNNELTKFYLSLPESTRRYKDRVRVWEFSFEVYTQFVETLSDTPFSSMLRVEPFPAFVSTAILNYMKTIKENSGPVILNIEPELRKALRPFQIQGVEFVIRRGGRALIGE